jgi:hypothetical protein
MARLELSELQKRIDASPALLALKDKLEAEVTFRSDASIQFDPFLIVALISLTIQIIRFCQDRKKKELMQDIRDLRSLPARKSVKLRRQVNALWHEHYPGEAREFRSENPLLVALYEASETADDETLEELIKLATIIPAD